MLLNYLIIDDEPIAHSLIEGFARELDYLHLVGNCHNAIQALPILKSQSIDLIFLDINMPKLSGFDFLKSLPNPPQVIIISAHKEHALESYEYKITDYLLKPFNFERFFKSIEKVLSNLSALPLEAQTDQISANASDSCIFIKDDKKHHKVPLTDIVYIKANGNFTSVYLKDRTILSQMKMSDFVKLLPNTDFSQIHRSYLIAHQAVTLVSANEVHLKETIVPVGRVFKENIGNLLGKS